MTSVEAGGTRRPRNRAVAAVTAIDAALLGSPLIVGGLTAAGPSPCGAQLTARHAEMAALLRGHVRPDPHRETREALRALQNVPVPRDEFALMDDATLCCICAFLGERSRDLVRIGSVCRRLRNIVVPLTPQRIVVVPDMIPLAALSNHTVADSLCAFFATHKRGQFVRQLSLLDSKHASLLSIAVPLPVCSLHVFPSLVKLMPHLTSLDMRGVLWECRDNPHLPRYFLSDLHLVAPRLQTLKVGMELFSQWSPGWWQRLAALENIVVGSRRDQAVAVGAEPKQGLLLCEDFFDMLRAPRRSWRLKLWCPLQREVLVRLLLSPQALPGLHELTLNLSNTDVLEDSKQQPAWVLKESKSHKGPKKAAVQSSEETDGRAFFMSLRALTLANVERHPLMLAELLELMSARAPRLKFFSVVNTTRVPPPPPVPSLKSKKRL